MPVEPRLLNPTDVIFSQKADVTSQRYDHNRRNTVNRVVRDASFTIKGQVRWNPNSVGPEMQQQGVDENDRGYVILRTKDLDALGKVIERGDKILKLGSKEVNFFVLRTEFGSHYDGEFKLVKVIYGDRDGQDG